ncbi:hypothetical protein SCRM01_294 [Synechococcus phage S-CRM01]|uniref:hypothetical protein n=1 Tax=Synechococcus phage S-CRM01 TaxID=1026955 RepID=UPI000209E322|nr:hypothetical protein SCRM01_294 [Synechococcus phage S-CRM01]AEC53240.1 hypothetical protein SCRM01_294 [Synechococcus phage S-CRM01]
MDEGILYSTEEEQFQLMYRFPGADDYIPLPSAIDYLYWRSKYLGENLVLLEKKTQELEERINSLESSFSNLRLEVIDNEYLQTKTHDQN